jgi:proline iminopeptidase
MTDFSLTTRGRRLAAYRTGTEGIPLLVVHGGPGVPCSYVYHAHTQYAAEGFQVVSWDQLGCGKSDRPEDMSLWTVERYVEEVEDVRRQLGWDRFLMIGNSWGGMLGLEYCLHFPQHVKAFVMGNSAASMPLLIEGFNRCKAQLGSDTVRMMQLRESEGTTDHPEYVAARTLLMYRHMLRMDQWPQAVLDSMGPEAIGQGPFAAMFGPHFYNASGNLRTWDRMADLPSIRTPVLLTTSEWDYLLPDYARIVWEHLPDAELAIFRNSGHMPFWDAADRYHPTVLRFLKKHA